jgi:hypothetical protein
VTPQTSKPSARALDFSVATVALRPGAPVMGRAFRGAPVPGNARQGSVGRGASATRYGSNVQRGFLIFSRTRTIS